MRCDPIEPRSASLLLELLNAYTVAAGAAGLAVMACAQPVHAEIGYTPANVSLFTGGPVYDLDLNGDGVPDFEFRDVRLFGSGAYLYVKFNSVMVSLGQFPYVLPAGARIAGSRRFAPGNFPNGRVIEDVNQSSSIGYWGNVANHYIGLKFQINVKPITDGRGRVFRSMCTNRLPSECTSPVTLTKPWLIRDYTPARPWALARKDP